MTLLRLFVETVNRSIYEIRVLVQFFSSQEINVVKSLEKFFSLKIGNTFPLSSLLPGGFEPAKRRRISSRRFSPSKNSFRRERSDDWKYVCASQARWISTVA